MIFMKKKGFVAAAMAAVLASSMLSVKCVKNRSARPSVRIRM